MQLAVESRIRVRHQGSKRSTLLATGDTYRRSSPGCSPSSPRNRRIRHLSRARITAALALLTFCGRHPVQASWIDPDTLPEDRTKTFASDEREFELVFSDEFDREGRTFRDGEDPRWTALNKNDYTNKALQFYGHDMIKTRNGSMIVTTNATDVEFTYYDTPNKKTAKMKKHYLSGMVQGWNKFCFTGGIVEIRATLPGASNIGGLWPAMWIMGNLARATFTASSDFTWPWSYDQCNRSTEEQAEWQRQQEISACDTSVHYGLHPHTGRGAPEIDILETMAGPGKGVAPGTKIEDRPSEGTPPPPGTWYENLTYGENSSLNIWFYGVHLEHDESPHKSYFADAVSGNTPLAKTHFEEMHTYRLDWQPSGGTKKGYLHWYVDDYLIYGISEASLHSFHGAQIPTEPSYLLLNTAISSNWGFPVCPSNCDCTCYNVRDPKCACALDPGFSSVFPAEFEIDWVRVYQARNESVQTVGCSPEAYPTRDFIKAHAYRYREPGDDTVMREVRHGGGACRVDSDCNGNKCHRTKCKCEEVWTGPHCRAAAAGDDSKGRKNEWPMQSPFVPPALSRIFILLVAVFGVTLFARYTQRRRRYLYASLDKSGVTVPPPAMASLR